MYVKTYAVFYWGIGGVTVIWGKEKVQTQQHTQTQQQLQQQVLNFGFIQQHIDLWVNEWFS